MREISDAFKLLKTLAEAGRALDAIEMTRTQAHALYDKAVRVRRWGWFGLIGNTLLMAFFPYPSHDHPKLYALGLVVRFGGGFLAAFFISKAMAAAGTAMAYATTQMLVCDEMKRTVRSWEENNA